MSQIMIYIVRLLSIIYKQFSRKLWLYIFFKITYVSSILLEFRQIVYHYYYNPNWEYFGLLKKMSTYQFLRNLSQPTFFCFPQSRRPCATSPTSPSSSLDRHSRQRRWRSENFDLLNHLNICRTIQIIII